MGLSYPKESSNVVDPRKKCCESHKSTRVIKKSNEDITRQVADVVVNHNALHSDRRLFESNSDH
jgi:hypothetical protein